jgi:malonyl-CoA decarboxylase
MMERHSEELKPLLMKLAARYLLREKHHGKPLDGVARFHIGNGAEMWRLNYKADESRKGWHSSLGIMINYRYKQSTVADNKLQYELDFNIPMCKGVSKWLSPDGN